MSSSGSTRTTDLKTFLDGFLEDVRAGLRDRPRRIPSKYLYDKRGSELFDDICELPEYYPTRTELGIMRRHVADMARAIGPDCLLIEYGSGSSVKIRLLLDELESIAAYVPVDISDEHLALSARRLAEEYPSLEVLPVCADFGEPFEPPTPRREPRRRVVYFPGSTIGNLTQEEARAFLNRCRKLAGDGGGLLIGFDCPKDTEVLKKAYNDSSNVTAAFNLNLLERMNRELGADFDLGNFRHEARYNPQHSRMEMHLVSEDDQQISVAGEKVALERDETILTEYSHKYSPEVFRELCRSEGFASREEWTDERRWFAIHFYEAV